MHTKIDSELYTKCDWCSINEYPGTRCESNPSGCPYAFEEIKPIEDENEIPSN